MVKDINDIRANIPEGMYQLLRSVVSNLGVDGARKITVSKPEASRRE